MNSIELNESIHKAKYRIVNEYVQKSGNDIDRIDHAYVIEDGALVKMCKKYRIMWNLPCLVMKREILLKALNAINFDFESLKISIREDLLIAYSFFYYSQKLHFLDEIGYIYYKGAKNIKRDHHTLFVNRLAHQIYSNVMKEKLNEKRKS